MQTDNPLADRTGKTIQALARQAGFNLEPTLNMLYTVRGNHAQLENFARLLAAPKPAQMTDEKIDELLQTLDGVARAYNGYEYGLPLFDNSGDSDPLSTLRAAVRDALK